VGQDSGGEFGEGMAGGERPMATGARRRAERGRLQIISFLTDLPRKEAIRSWLLASLGGHGVSMACFGFALVHFSFSTW
jgi:hypothetical protein